MSDAQEIHLTAIGGVGMTALAGLLRALGHRVRGSDLEIYPPASDELARLEVPVARGYSAENLLPEPDLIVMGNAISRDNPEAVAARAAGIETISMPEAIQRFCLPGRIPLVLAGTHGKTTSSTFLSWILDRAGEQPGWFIGGAPLDLPGPYAVGAGRPFVLEGDEYDSAYFDKGPKFLHYQPQGVVLTSVEFDHADIYRDLAHVQVSFAALLALLPREAPLIVSADYPAALEVANGSNRPFVTFASDHPADWQITDLVDGPDGLRFIARGRGESIEFLTPMLGAMNARNLLGVALLARAIGVSVDTIREAAATFHGVRRRQEVVVDAEVTLIDDFLPIIRLRLRWLSKPFAVAFPNRRHWALFDPRSNTTRRSIFQNEITDALSVADCVGIGPVNRPELLRAEERFSPEAAVEKLAGASVLARACADVADIENYLQREVRKGDVVTILSNGAFGGLRGRLAERFWCLRGLLRTGWSGLVRHWRFGSLLLRYRPRVLRLDLAGCRLAPPARLPLALPCERIPTHGSTDTTLC